MSNDRELKKLKTAKERLKRDQARKNTETIKKNKREAARERRQAIKNDPKLHEKYKEKERERWHQRLKDGKIKRRDELSEREKRRKQRLVRESTRRWRQKKNCNVALEDSPPVPEHIHTQATDGKEVTVIEAPSSLPAPTLKPEVVANKVKRGRQRKSAYRTDCHRKLEHKSKENVSLQRALWRTRKALANARKQIPLTPRSQIRKQLKGKNIAPEIKRKLVFGEVLHRQVRSAVTLKSIKERGTIYQILRGNLLKKYKLQSTSGLSPKMLRKYGRKKTTPSLQHDRAVSNRKVNSIKKIQQFFLSDDNSIECPDKKANKILFGREKIKRRKRYLRGSLKDLYVLYCQKVENPLSYAKFCAYKPFNVVKRDLKERDTCLCQQCENMELLISALHQGKVLDQNSNLSFLRSICCSPRTEDCYQRKCNDCKDKKIDFKECDDNLVIKYNKWVTIKEKKKDWKKSAESAEIEDDGQKKEAEKEIKRTVKKEELPTIKSLKDTLIQSLDKFLGHTFRDHHQLHTLRLKRENLKPGEIYIWMDFSENYNCKYYREIQSHYYGGSRENVVLHTGRVYLEKTSHSFCTVTECTRKDPPAIIAHLVPILDKYLTPGITTVYFQSDSPTQQYRNKEMFYLATQYLQKLYPQITSVYWNYSEAGHGKGAPDGIGAKVKTSADEETQTGNDVPTFDALLSTLKKKLVKIHIDTVDTSRMLEIDKAVPSLTSFKGTMKVHQLTWTKETPAIVEMNSVSCFECLPGSACKHFRLENSPWLSQDKEQENETIDDPKSVEKPPKKSRQAKAKAVQKRDQTKYSCGDWVAVKYGSHWYPGYVEKVLSQKLVVNFMFKHQKKEDLYLWPKDPDTQSVFKTDVIHKLSAPPSLVDRVHFKVPESDVINSKM